MPKVHHKVIEAIVNCRTETYGISVYECEACAEIHRIFRSCGNRHCPTCQNHKIKKWLHRQLMNQLPGHHFMVTFTVPEQLRRFIRSNQKLCYPALFKASSDVLKVLAADPKHICGDLPGFFGILHTWGPLPLKFNALGDLAVFLNFGVLGALGAWIVQTGTLSRAPVIWAVPMSLLVVGILHSNNCGATLTVTGRVAFKPWPAGWAITLVAGVLFTPFFMTQGLGRFDFWRWMSTNLTILLVLVTIFDRHWWSEIRIDIKHRTLLKVGFGVLSALFLYMVFYAGNIVSRWIFSFAQSGIENIYAFKSGVSPFRIAVLMVLLIGPGEELFWRGFLQRRLQME